MGIIGAILTAVWLILYGILTSPYPNSNAHALGIFAIITGVAILLELVFANWSKLPRP